ncbi:DUF4394 domain-containing protein [Noviherbaspirillum saxi]|nr:DUF4394 domain-containing protein [Noviherbaspirillum saxi]
MQHSPSSYNRQRSAASHLILFAAAAALTACATIEEPVGAMRKETVYAVTSSNQLISFNAGQPQKLLSRKPLNGLQNGETITGIDYRVVKGWLYALGSSVRLYRITPSSGAVQMIGSGPIAVSLTGTEFGVDFNPTVDRIRIVSNSGQNLRVHPDTGAVVDGDPNTPGVQLDGNLAYSGTDPNAGKKPAAVAAAYTYNKQDEKITTNFAIDAAQGMLVTQGTREGKGPAISPNTGQLLSVGPLGIGAFERASFDIADISGAAFTAITRSGEKSSSWYEIDLDSGKASMIGKIDSGEPVVGIAIEP